jgi:GTP cyclohydrolase I
MIGSWSLSVAKRRCHTPLATASTTTPSSSPSWCATAEDGELHVRGGKTDASADAKRVMNPTAEAPHIALVAPAGTDEPARSIDEHAAQRAAADLLLALGADLSAEGLRETPRRMAAAYAELLTSQPFRPTTFPNEEGYDELVLVRSIPFHSLCMHHLLPFHGVAHIGYLPGEQILGLSRFARVVELFARDLQVQERLTKQIADWLHDQLAPKGVGVVLEAEHLCKSLRGVQKFGAKTLTSALHGWSATTPAHARSSSLSRQGATHEQ